MKKLLFLSCITAITLLFVSCPEPLTEDVVTASQDSIAPTLEILSPSGNEEFYSVVEFLGVVSDDALKEGDAKGDIASISFSISNDDFRGGTINISPTGVVTQDSSGGPDLIEYDAESGLVSFSFSTIEPNPLGGVVSVSVLVVDRNENESEYRISLNENEGPWFDLELVDENGLDRKYLAGKNLYLSGTVGNSEDVKTKANEIVRIEWTIAGSITGTLDLSDGATYTSDYTPFDTLSYYNESTGLYERKISGYLSEVLAGTFSYNPADRTFDATIFMNYNLDNLGSVFMEIEVEDQSGHITEKSLIVSENKIGPNLGFNLLSDGSLGHFSATSTDAAKRADIITGSCGENISSLLDFKIQLKNGDHISSEYSYDDGSGVIPASADKNFVVDIRDFVDEFTADAAYDSAVDTYMLLTAVGSNGVDSFITLPIVEDSDAPGLNNFSISRQGGGSNGAYATDSSALDIEFTVDEDGLIDANEVTIDLTAGVYNVSTTGTGIKTFSPADSAWSGGLSEGEITIQINLADRLGNTASYNAVDDPTVIDETITFYPFNGGNLALSNIAVAVTADDPSLDWADETLWARDGEEILLTVNSPSRDLESVSGVQIDGSAATLVSTNTYSYTKTGSAGTGNYLSQACTIEDKAGNIYTVSGNSTLRYDGIDPVSTGLTTGISGPGVPAGTLFINEYMDPASINIDLGGLGTALDTYFYGFSYKVFSSAYSSVIETPGTTYSTLLDDDTALAAAAETTHTANIILYDIAGNQLPLSFDFTIDKTDPDISGVELTMSGAAAFDVTADTGGYLNGKLISDGTNDEKLELSGFTAPDITSVTYEVESEGETAVNMTAGAGSVDLSNFNVTHVDNTYTVTVRAYDGAGNSSESTFNIMLDTVIPPDYNIVLEGTGTYNSYYLNSYLPDVASDDKASFTGLGSTAADFDHYDYSLSDQSGSNLGNTDKVSLEFFSGAGYTDPSYTLSVSVQDAAGNLRDKDFTLFLDKTVPDLTAMDYSHSGTGWYDNAGNGKTYLNAAILGADPGSIADDPNDQILTLTNTPSGVDNFNSYDYTIDSESGSSIASTNKVIPMDWVDESTGDEVDYTLNVIIYDQAGNHSDKNFHIYKDTALWDLDSMIIDLNGTGVANSNYLNNAILGSPSDENLDLGSISLNPDETFVYSFDGTSGNTITPSSGNFTIDVDHLDTGHVDGTYPVVFTLSDEADNSATRTFNIYLDTVVPNLSTLSYTASGPGVYENGGTYYINSGLTVSADDDTLLFSNLSALVPDLAEYHYNFSGDGVGDYTSSNPSASISLEGLSSNSEGSFTLTVDAVDTAGNISADKVFSNLEKDTVAPVLTGFDLVLSGDGVTGTSPTYINGSAHATNTKIDLLVEDGLDGLSDGDTDPDALSTVSSRYTAYAFSFDGFTSSTTPDPQDDSITYSEFSSQSEGAKTLEVRVFDAAHNYVSDTVAFTIDRIKPSAISTVTGMGTPTVVVTFEAAHGYTSGGPTLQDNSGAFISPNIGATTLTYNATFNITQFLFTSTQYNYTIPADIYFDEAGNSNYTVYDLNTNNSVTTVSGLSAPNMTIQPDITPSDGPRSYKSIRTYDYSSNSAMRAVENGQTDKFDISEISSLKKERMTSPVTVSSQTDSNVVEASLANIPERAVSDLDTSNKVLKEAMDEIALSEAAYEAGLQSLMTPRLTHKRLERIETIFEPEIVPPEIITVSATPFLTGGAADIEIVAGTEMETVRKPVSALFIQILGAVMLVLLTFGFITVLKKMSKT